MPLFLVHSPCCGALFPFDVCTGNDKTMKKSVSEYVALCMSLLNDPHQRVRHAAIGAFTQLCDAFATDDGIFCKRQVGHFFPFVRAYIHVCV